MAYNSGEIYFVHEETGVNGRRSPFIKIGLIAHKEGRNSYQRLTEHQTGNPRKLYLNDHQIITTEAVNVVELRLHQIFAECRVSGEWFEFETDEQLELAVSQAKLLAEEMQEIVPIFKRADELDMVKSNGQSKVPDELDKQLLLIALEAQMKIKKVEEAEDLIQELLTIAVERGEDIQTVAKTIVRTYKPKFDAKLFKEENSDLWEEYAVNVEKFEHTFRFKTNASDEYLTDESFKKAIQEIIEIIESVKSNSQIQNLNEPMLKLTHLKGAAQYDVDLAKAKLKVSTAEFDEISEVCSWKRATKVVRELDEERLAIDHPQLVLKYVSTPQPKKAVQAKRHKAK